MSDGKKPPGAELFEQLGLRVLSEQGPISSDGAPSASLLEHYEFACRFAVRVMNPELPEERAWLEAETRRVGSDS